MKVEHTPALGYIFPDELYLLKNEQSRYGPGQRPAERVESVRPDFRFIGKNQKKVLILVHYPGDDLMDETHLTALENILKRKTLGLDDVAILNMHQHPHADHEAINAFFSPQKIVIMGNLAVPPGIEQPALHSITTLGGVQTLYSFSFAEMMNDNERKKLFWEQMKKL